MQAEPVCLGKPNQPPESLILPCSSSNIEGVTDLCSNFSATSSLVSQSRPRSSQLHHLPDSTYAPRYTAPKPPSPSFCSVWRHTFIGRLSRPCRKMHRPSRLSCQRSREKSTREGKATRGSRGGHLSGTSITRSIVRAHRKGGTTSLPPRGWARTASRPKGVLVRQQRCPRNE
jgi:hypothetical protein